MSDLTRAGDKIGAAPAQVGASREKALTTGQVQCLQFVRTFRSGVSHAVVSWDFSASAQAEMERRGYIARPKGAPDLWVITPAGRAALDALDQPPP